MSTEASIVCLSADGDCPVKYQRHLKDSCRYCPKGVAATNMRQKGVLGLAGAKDKRYGFSRRPILKRD